MSISRFKPALASSNLSEKKLYLLRFTEKETLLRFVVFLIKNLDIESYLIHVGNNIESNLIHVDEYNV